MTLSDELYFEITMTGAKSDIKRIAKFLSSGGLDDFFEIDSDYITFDDGYAQASDLEETSLTLSNDDYGIEIDEFEVEDFLDVLCRATKSVDVSGTLYDLNDEEYNFKSDAGSSYYLDKSKISFFNEDEDKEADESDEADEE